MKTPLKTSTLSFSPKEVGVSLDALSSLTQEHLQCFCFSHTDASTYAHFLFNAFDTDHNGSVSFEVRRALPRESHETQS